MKQESQNSFAIRKTESFHDYEGLARQDHIRLHNIFYLLENRDFSHCNGYHWLKNLSLQFDALSVYEDMVRHSVDTAFGSQRGLAGKVLSFLYHGLELPNLNSAVKDYIVGVITDSNDLQQLHVTLKDIIDFDQKRHEMLNQRKKWLERIEKCKRLPHLPIPGKSEKTSLGNLFWAISNSPDLKKIRQEMANPMFLKEEMDTGRRFDRAIDILKKGTDEKIVPEFYEAIDVAYESIKENRRMFEELRKKIIGKHYHDIQFHAGLLYEYENLNIIYQYGDTFLSTFDPQNTESRYQLIQCLSILSEGLHGLFLPVEGGHLAEEVIPIRGVLNFLRNKVFEHPTPVRQKKLHALMVSGAITDNIFKTLSAEIKIILTKIEARRRYLHTLISGQNNWQNDLKKLFDLYKKKGKLPEESGRDESNTPKKLEDFDQLKIWKTSDFPLLQSLRRYFIYPSLNVNDITEDDTKTQQQKQTLFDLSEKPLKEIPQHTWKELFNALDAIKVYIGPLYHRDTLLAKLNGSLENRLKAKWILNEFYQILRYLLEHPSQSKYLDKINPVYQKTFEYFYLNLRDQRNFQTHDLWRSQDEDLNRLANVMLHTLIIMEQALNPSSSPQVVKAKQIDNFLEELDRKERENIGITSDLLNDFGLTINCIDKNGKTLLHQAMQRFDLKEIVEKLVDWGCNIHWIDQEGHTALMEAVTEEQAGLAECLLKLGAIPSIKNIYGEDEIDLSFKFFGDESEKPKKEFIKLLKTYASKGRYGQADALHSAIKAHDFSEIETLLRRGYFPCLYDANGEVPLVLSIKEELPIALHMAEILLNHGASIDQMTYGEKTRALFYAAWDYNPGKVSFLLQRGAQPSIADEESPLSQAIFTSKESAQLLLEAGADLSVKGTAGNSLLLSLMNSHSRKTDNVKALLEYGADPNSCDKFGTSLHNVLERNGEEVSAKILLEAGAAPFVKGWSGLYYNKTPISVARSHLKPFLNTWTSHQAKMIAAQVEKALASLPWTPFWKQRVLSLYNDAYVFFKADTLLHAHHPQGSMNFQVIDEKNPNNLWAIDPNEAVNSIFTSINSVQNLLAADLLEDAHDFLSTHPQHKTLLSLMGDLKRTKAAHQIYRDVCEEDYYLDVYLTDQERLDHSSLTSYPLFKNQFSELIQQKQNLEQQIIALLLEDEATLKNYLYQTVVSGKWLKSKQNGTGILQAYAFFKGFNLVFWSSTDSSGEADITSTILLSSSDLHLMHPINEEEKSFVILKNRR